MDRLERPVPERGAGRFALWGAHARERMLQGMRKGLRRESLPWPTRYVS